MLNYGGWTREREGGGLRRIMMLGRGLWEIIVRVMRGSCLIFRKNELVYDAVANSEYYSLEVPMKVGSVSGRVPERRHPLREPIRNAMSINYLIIDHIFQDMNEIYQNVVHIKSTSRIDYISHICFEIFKNGESQASRSSSEWVELGVEQILTNAGKLDGLLGFPENLDDGLRQPSHLASDLSGV